MTHVHLADGTSFVWGGNVHQFTRMLTRARERSRNIPAVIGGEFAWVHPSKVRFAVPW